MAERNLRTGQVDPGQRNPIYMTMCIMWQVLRELFTETYSFWSTVKILLHLGIVFIVLLLVSAGIHILSDFVSNFLAGKG